MLILAICRVFRSILEIVLKNLNLILLDTVVITLPITSMLIRQDIPYKIH